MRRSPYFNKAPLTPTNTPKTPKRLFDPSSKTSVLNDWQPSPPKSSRRDRLPSPVKASPVKFDPIEDNDENSDINNIVANLDFAEEDHAVTVTDEELAKIAAESTQQLQDIQDEMNQVLSNIVVTEKDRMETRSTNTMELVLDDDSNDAMVMEEPKIAPIFDMAKRNSSQIKSKGATPTKKNKGKQTVADSDQMIIDAGQKLIDPVTCPECGHVYNPGQAEDEAAHQKVHDFFQGKIPFKGWKNYESIQKFGQDEELIAVNAKKHKNLFDKVETEYLKVVDRDLGIEEGSSRARNRDETKFFMYVSDGRIVGILMSEALDSKHKITRAVRNPKNKKEWLLEDVVTSNKVLVGVSRIWVAKDFRRNGIASEMVKAMKCGFYGSAMILKNGEFAFSHTTPSGSEFASKFIGGNFLTYSLDMTM